MRKETAVKTITFLMVSSLLAGMLPAMLPAKGAEAEQRYTVRGTGVCEDDDSEDEDLGDDDFEDEDPDDDDPEDDGQDKKDPDDNDSDDGDPDDGDSDEEDPDGDDPDKDDPDDDDSDDDKPDNEDFDDVDSDDEDSDDDIPDDENDDRDIDDGSDVRIGVRAAKSVKGQNDGDDDPDDDDDPDEDDPDEDDPDDKDDPDKDDPDEDDPDEDDSKDTADVFVTITWDDHDDQDGIRPDYIRLKLLADGADSGKICDVDSLIGWTDELCDLDKYSGDHRIRYSVSVLPDEVITGTDGPGSYDYEVADVIESDDAFVCEIIAKHTPEVTGFEAAVQWNDDENAENTRPESITFRVRANGEKVLSLTVTKEDDWKAAFSGLAKYSGGKEIVYTLTEDVIRDYTPEITGNMKQGFTVVNHYTPGKTSVSVSKVWKDEQNVFGSRPETVTIRLLADGEDTGESIVLSGENDWTGVFAGLDANAEYTISEEIKGLNPDVESEDMESGDTSPEDRTPEDSSSEDKAPGDLNPEDRTPEEPGPVGKKSGDLSPEDKEPKEKEQGDSGSEDEEPEDPEEDPGKYDDTIPGEYKAEISGDAVEGFTVTNTFLPDYRYLLKDSGTAAMSGGSGEDGNTDESDETDVSNSGAEEQDDLANTGNEISKKTGANTGDENRRLLWEQLMIMVLAAGCIHHLRAGRRG